MKYMKNNELLNLILNSKIQEDKLLCLTDKLTLKQQTKLEAIYEIASRLNNLILNTENNPVFTSSLYTGKYCINLLQHEVNECFYLLLLNNQNKLIKDIRLFEGTINESIVYPRRVLEEVFKHHANTLIIAHNHPGQSLKPSTNDIQLTIRLKTLCDLVQINLLDHIIVTIGNYYSLKENGDF